MAGCAVAELAWQKGFSQVIGAARRMKVRRLHGIGDANCRAEEKTKWWASEHVPPAANGTKRGARNAPLFFFALEVQLCADLNDARLKDPIDSIANLAEIWSTALKIGRCPDYALVGRGGDEGRIEMIKEVEDISANLEAPRLLKTELLVHRKVDVFRTRHANCVCARRSSKAAVRWRGKCTGIKPMLEGPPARQIAVLAGEQIRS